ncbi:MAG: hypothetical protein E7430_10335 [Ruminococcaceae bacterium]|nr:hypothetical protein [Oscillospiraceae bacterium]
MYEPYYTNDSRNTTEKIYDCAYAANSLQELADKFYHLTGLSTVIADSLDYIVAATPDIQVSCSTNLEWNNFVEQGLLPTVTIPVNEPDPGSPSVLLHHAALGNGRFCVICSIRHNGSALLKLAVVLSGEPADNEIHLITVLAKSLYSTWFRLKYTGHSIFDVKSRFLLSLLEGANIDTVPYPGTDGFSPEGPYVIATLTVTPAVLTDIAYSSVCDEISILCGKQLLSAFTNNEYVFLINASDTSYLSDLDDFSKRHDIILGISRRFSDLSKTSEHHLQAHSAAETASRFKNFKGCARYDDMKLFLMFDMLSKTDAAPGFMDRQVDILAQSDAEKNTDFLRTLFCWLLNSQHASASAKQLGVHRNTLDNRLAKINELIDANWNSSVYSTCMLYSIYVTLDRLDQLEFFY